MGKLIKCQELQSVFSISRSTIDRWRKEGMPFIKVGRGVRFDEDEVYYWIKIHKQEIKSNK